MPGFVDNSENGLDRGRQRRRRRVPVKGQNQTTRKITSETESEDSSFSDAGSHVDDSYVPEDPQAMLKYPKHPLKDSWTFWCLDPSRSRNWEECLVPLNTFEFVEDFWALFRHLASLNELSSGADYMMFKEGIKPQWEDPRNRRGGRWMIKVEPHNRDQDMNTQAWLELLLLLIGDGVVGEDGGDGANKVTGAVCNVRKLCDKLSLWMADSGDEDGVLRAGRAFQAALQGSGFRQPLRFERHVDVEAKTSSQAKALYTLPSPSPYPAAAGRRSSSRGGGGGGEYPPPSPYPGRRSSSRGGGGEYRSRHY